MICSFTFMNVLFVKRKLREKQIGYFLLFQLKTQLLLIVCLLFSWSGVFGHQMGPAKRLNDSTIATSDSVALYLKVVGRGAPCIFVHGGPGAWSRSFEAMGGNALEKHLTMYYYDQRGSGRSQPAPNNDYSLDRMVEDIEDIRSLTGSEQVYVMGHSFGGVLAFKYAAKYPTHVKGLILLNSTLSLIYSLQSQITFINKLIDTDIIVEKPDSLMTSFIAAKTLLHKHDMEYKMLSDSRTTVEKLDSIDNAPRSYAFAQRALSMPEYFNDFTKETAEVNIPVLVIAGTDDHNIGPNHYKQFRFPRQQTRLIKGGHVLYYEKNKEFVEAVLEFINNKLTKGPDSFKALN